MYNNLLDAVLQNFVLATDIEIIQKVLLAFSNVVLLGHEDVDILEIFVDVQLFPKHSRKLHSQRLDSQTQLIS
jgi:hypothetical protein